MSSRKPSSAKNLANLDAYKSIMERGVDPHNQPPLLPTLVVETDSEIHVAVLEPAPEPEETFDVVMQWKQAVLEDREDTQLHCIGFSSGPAEITLGVFPPTEGTWLVGRINTAAETVKWSRRTKSK